MTSPLRADLERAATYRYLSLLFAPPDHGRRQALAALAREVAPPLALDAAVLAQHADVDDDGHYHSVLGFAGACRDTQAAYETAALGGRGPLLADIAGFYRAFGYDPAPLGALTPDHAAAELGFLGFLAFKTAYARHRGSAEQVAVCEQAADAFVRRHAGRFLPPFFEAILAATGGGFYADAARFGGRAFTLLEDGRIPAPAPPRRARPLPVLDRDGCG